MRFNAQEKIEMPPDEMWANGISPAQEPKRGFGCGTILLAFVAVIVVGIFSLKIKIWFDDRAEMREDLRLSLQAGRWSGAPANFDIEHVWSGSAYKFYRLKIPHQEVEGFLTTVQRACTRQIPIETVHDGFGNYGVCTAGWWRPQDEKELHVIRMGAWSWSVAASKETGYVYIMFEGH